MYIHGQFINQKGETVSVYIVTKKSRTEEIEIEGSDERLLWTDDSVEIATEINDTFDVIVTQSATIRLQAREHIADFFCADARDAVVNVYKDDQCVFAGYIEPQSYSQPYNEVYDEVELNCIDALSALQYSNYRDIGSTTMTYAIAKAEAGERTFYEIMAEMLDAVTEDLDILGNGSVRYLYDKSRHVNDDTDKTLTFRKTAVNDLLFLGDEEDDTWTADEVMEAMLKFYNLHIVQDGLTFRIFAWESVKGSAIVNWEDIGTGEWVEKTERKTTDITTDIVADCDTQISIGEIYNQLELTATIEKIESVVESPLDDESIDSPFQAGLGYQLYFTEISSYGEGKTAREAFEQMTHDGKTSYDGGERTDWYVRVMSNAMWKFYGAGGIDLYEKFACDSGKYQDRLPDWLGENLGCALLAFGSRTVNAAKDDNAPTSKVDMTNYLVISVNGNGIDNDEANTYPSVDALKSMIPCAVYTGNAVGGNFSPVDKDTTNYIVISGKVALSPKVKMTAGYKTLKNGSVYDKTESGLLYKYGTVPCRDNDDGRFYTRKYYTTAGSPKEDAVWDGTDSVGLMSFSDKCVQDYEFQYSAIGDETDTISKVAVLACMLVIGDKCVVETGTEGKPSDFSWQPYKTLEECADEDEYYQQCFYIGFDPKIGDKLIGTEFDLQNNIDYTMGVDAEGIAIPIEKGDKVSGQVQFKILCPVNVTWDVITRRHPTAFRHTKWSTTSVPLMAHVQDIFIEDFKVEVTSDNGKISLVNTDNDVVYMSDTTETFRNKKDDLEMKIHSALTSTECAALGVANDVKLSTPTDTTTDDAVLTIHDNISGETAKAEQLYVNAYYQEYHAPRIEMDQNVEDGSYVGLFNHYRHPALGKTFFVEGYGRNLTEGTVQLKLKEIEDND